MRDTVENVSLLQKQLNTLQLENQILKNILDRSGLSYLQELIHLREPEGTENFEPNQGARIIHPREIRSLECPLMPGAYPIKRFRLSRRFLRETGPWRSAL